MTDPPVDRELRARLRALRDPVLTSRRLRFELPTLRRVAEVVPLLNDRAVARWTLRIPSPYRPRDAWAWIQRAPRQRRAGLGLSLHLVRRSDGALVGGIGLHRLDGENGRAEVGYWIGRPYRREGLAAEATDALCRFAFRQLGLHRIEAHVFPGNAASEGVLRASGFRREGRTRASVVKAGRYADELLYGRVAPGSLRSSRGRGSRRGVSPAPTR